MNIFILSECPIEAARMQFDKHVVKMPIETAQMLCTVGFGSYKPTHANHPCTRWAGKSEANWDWLVVHGLALCEEYTYRYGRRHKSQDVIENVRPPEKFESVGQTPFAIAMPDEFKLDSAMESYRAYYMSKSSFAKWTKRDIPLWWSVK